MKKASIISIGNELISGQTVDTNSAYLSGRLLSIGMPTVSIFAIGDEMDRVVKTLDLACSDADVIIVTGGLGPTDDDLTRQAIAEFLGVELELKPELVEHIREYFAKRGSKMYENNRCQAYIPTGAKVVENRLGTAPGFIAEQAGKLIASLPGVPSEMKQMFEDTVFGEAEKLSAGQAVVVKKLRCFGAGESQIAERIGDLMQRGRNPLINCTVQYGIITLAITATAESRKEAESMAGKDKKQLNDILGDLVYGCDSESLAEVVGRKLTGKKKTIALAESCTGGLIAKTITDVSGASDYFTYGWVVYSNDAKISELGVDASLVEKHGAVSSEVAEAMANGAKKRAGSDYAISVTGIAGPGGGSNDKPIGLVYVGLADKNGCEVRCFKFSHDRGFVRLRTAQTALNMLRLKLDELA